jgi:1-deoxy-D-xylulose-5-phosphate reductoisomerase
LNAANEVAVELFLGGHIGFGGIPEVIEASLRGHRPGKGDSLDEILAADREVREQIARTYRVGVRPVS